MVPSETSFNDGLSAVDRIYATHSGVETDKDGKTKHLDARNKGGKGHPVDLDNLGVPEDTDVDAEELAPTGAPEANPEVDGATDPVTREPVEGEDA